MFRPLPLFIGLRYTAAKRKNNFISFISFVSIGGIALGVMTMIVVLSVMNGFQKEVAERSIAMAFHNQILNDRTGHIVEWEALMPIAKAEDNVVGAAPFIEGQGLINASGLMLPVQVYGVDPQYEAEVSPIAETITVKDAQGQLVEGAFDILATQPFGVMISQDMANRLGVRIGDYISLITSDINVTVAGATPRMKRLKVVALFRAGVYEYDISNIFVNLKDAGILYRLPKESVTGVRLKLAEPMKARETAFYLQTKLQDRAQMQLQHQGTNDSNSAGNRLSNNSDAAVSAEESYSVYTWVNQFAALFKMIEIEKISMFLIMSMIVAVAVFNVVSMLVMVVTEKRSEIAILRTLGLPPRKIMAIFMVQGTFIGFFGAVIGIILGLLIAFNVADIVHWIEHLVGKTLFEPSIYPISEIPSIVLFSDVATIAGIAFLLASFATLYPAWKASRTQPAEALRYE